MTCINPRLAYKKTNGQFTLRKVGDNAPIEKSITVPCGSCMPCRVKRTTEWATRMVHEAYMHKERSSFITLTYDDEHLPQGNTLVPEDISKFIKALRKKVAPHRFRAYMVGEYGEIGGRAHYHAILFGYSPNDLKPYTRNKHGDVISTSEILANTWKKGFVTVGEFNETTAAYCAKYVTKAVTGKKAKEYYTEIDPETGEVISKHPPFQRASNRPGIGIPFYEKHKEQLYALDFTVIGTSKKALPKAYDRKYRHENPDHYKEIKKTRNQQLIEHSNRNPNLKTIQGLNAVKTILDQKLARKKRDIG